uniref:F-box associated beta-propeller type 1 domain-containing protein n=2 Tax=Chenopodium quinoa TaxID=63459 RepID=A0A803L2L2_CHEQI
MLGYLIIWNPVIHQWTKFLYPLLEGFRNFTWGFGYVHSSDDYKVVRISEAEESRVIVAHVFSLRSKKWEQIHDERLHGYSLHGRPSLAGVLVNETLYWIMYERGRGEKQCILGFDLVHERFDEIRGLIPGDSYLSGFRFLGCMGGSLAMSRFTSSGDVSISILKQKGQIEYIGLYRDMNLSSCCDVVGFTRAGKFFIQLGDQKLGLVDPNSSPKKYTQLVTFGEQGSTRVLSYTPSLISPLAFAEMPKE